MPQEVSLPFAVAFSWKDKDVVGFFSGSHTAGRRASERRTAGRCRRSPDRPSESEAQDLRTISRSLASSLSASLPVDVLIQNVEHTLFRRSVEVCFAYSRTHTSMLGIYSCFAWLWMPPTVYPERLKIVHRSSELFERTVDTYSKRAAADHTSPNQGCVADISIVFSQCQGIRMRQAETDTLSFYSFLQRCISHTVYLRSGFTWWFGREGGLMNVNIRENPRQNIFSDDPLRNFSPASMHLFWRKNAGMLQRSIMDASIPYYSQL